MTLKFAYWAPNVSGGLVISKLPQKTGWDFEDNVRYAQIAENLGFDYVLLQTRFLASYGAELQLEARYYPRHLRQGQKNYKLLPLCYQDCGIQG